VPLRNWLFRISDILDAGVSDRILWDTVQIDLPPLVPLLKEIIAKYSKID
jgi:uncharacterized protein with HEPN domain